MSIIRRDLDFQVKAVGDPDSRTLEFIGSTAGTDRYGDVIEVDGWDLSNYLKNPVFLWAHNYQQPPIGKAVRVEKTSKGLLFHIQFASFEEYPFADTIYKLYLGGYLRATSVGFRDLEREPIIDQEGRQTGWRYKRQELYELSAVPVPANPEALVMAVQKGVITSKEAEAFNASAPEWTERAVIPFKSYPTDPVDAPWDGPAEVKQAEVADLKKMCAWYDAENADTKGAYKLPHHRADGYNTVWRGVSAAMAALLGARGGVNIPEEDRRGVYRHLARHYEEFEKTPPEFKSYSEYDLLRIKAGLEPTGRDLAQVVLDLENRLADLEASEAPPWFQSFVETQTKLHEATLRALGRKTAPADDLYRQLLSPGQAPMGEGGNAQDTFESLLTIAQGMKNVLAQTKKGT